MSLQIWLAFVLASAVLLVIPGPTVLALIGYAVGGTPLRARQRTAMVAGVALGDAAALTASLAGLGGLLMASAFWFTVVKWAGGIYLLYLAVRMLAAGMSISTLQPDAALASARGLFGRTFLVTALNPKPIVFFVAFLPQFVQPGGDVARQLWILGATFIALSTLNATLYACFAGTARRLLAAPRARRGFNLAGGTMLGGAGVWALLARRPG
ncbi:MAG TPA: LysE family translocator [Burkholderiales bacterium]|jgi:threonine/homoserine/homoserine lactone efflux protein|nr:LysE family translocator [Burkholderiales bacterium]